MTTLLNLVILAEGGNPWPTILRCTVPAQEEEGCIPRLRRRRV